MFDHHVEVYDSGSVGINRFDPLQISQNAVLLTAGVGIIVDRWALTARFRARPVPLFKRHNRKPGDSVDGLIRVLSGYIISVEDGMYGDPVEPDVGGRWQHGKGHQYHPLECHTGSILTPWG